MELTYRNALRYGWMKLKGWWKVMAAYALVMIVFQALVNVLANFGDGAGALLTMPLSFVVGLINTAFLLYVVDASDQAGDVSETLKAYWEYLKAKFSNIWRFIGLQLAMLALMMVILLGLALVSAIPAIIGIATGSGVTGIFLALTVILGVVSFAVFMVFSIRLQWASFVLIDEHAGIKESLHRSWEMTRGRVLWFIGWGLLVAGLFVLGLLALLVGAIIVMLVAMLATAWIYRMMSGAAPAGSKKHLKQPEVEPVPAMPEVA